MALPTTIERLNTHLIGFVRAYTFQLARGIEPQLPNAGEGVDVVGHQAALQAARAIVRTARDKLDVRRMLSAMESYLAGMGRDISEPFSRLIEELGDKAHNVSVSEASQPADEDGSPAPAAVSAAVAMVDPGDGKSHGDGSIGNGVTAEPDTIAASDPAASAAVVAEPQPAGASAADVIRAETDATEHVAGDASAPVAVGVSAQDDDSAQVATAGDDDAAADAPKTDSND